MFRALAHYCWLSLVIAMAASIALLAMKSAPLWESRLVVDIIPWFLRISGILCGIIALFGIRRHGRKGILGPAIVGLVLWAVSLLLGTFAIKEIRDTVIRMKASASSSVAPASSSPGSESASDSTPKSVSITQTPPVYPDGSTRVEDKEFGFSFAVPEGYSVATEKNPDDRHAFKRKLMTEATRSIVIRKLNGDYSRRIATAKDFPAPPAGHAITSLTFDWRGREVGGTRSLDPRLAKPFVVFNIAIPLRKQTLLLEVGGAVESEPVIREVIEQVLASVVEESS